VKERESPHRGSKGPRPAVADYAKVARQLLASEEQSTRLWLLTGFLDREPGDAEIEVARASIPTSARVRVLLSEPGPGRRPPRHPYLSKWSGAHWVLMALTELGYPAGDESLRPLLDQVLGWLESPDYLRRIVQVRGRTRMHASIDAAAVWMAEALGLPDPRLDVLIERLLAAQWSDGGWNCDRDAGGLVSSFMESLIPLRALVQHGRLTGDRRCNAAANAAAELFLRRRLFRRLRDSTVMRREFTQLHYPCYWHYDILFGLTVMAEAGLIADPRCEDALDLLESKWLPDGGFPAEHRYYRGPGAAARGQRSPVDWGATGGQMNEFVTARALVTLHAAGRG
jgi:hypothetical protein